MLPELSKSFGVTKYLLRSRKALIRRYNLRMINQKLFDSQIAV